jgi:phosphate transport system permease protein
MATDTLSTPRSATERTKIIRDSLRGRHVGEMVFRGFGVAAIVIALGFVALLFIDIGRKAVPAFTQNNLHLQVTFDPAIIDPAPRPAREDFATEAEYQAAALQWQGALARLDWDELVQAAVLAAAPAGTIIEPREIMSIVDENYDAYLSDIYMGNPDIVGQTVPVDLIVSADAENWIKGNIDRSLPDNRQQLPVNARALIDNMVVDKTISSSFSWPLFTNVDSRRAPASAGLLGSFVGSLYMMLIVVLLAVPIGVAAAIYLEEFAPKSRITDFIEVNINNLAAVPSIVFGLLGAAVFINYMNLPRSAPLVGGLVLTLMTLPTIIIATRGALLGVSPALRQAALGMGASKTQMVFHHVLPVTFPSILTATILGIAHALGETAPLLLIGMKAFVQNVASTPLSPSTALPVQVYLWQNNENRNYFEPKTAAAIVVLLAVMIILNGTAIYLRSRLEKRA